MPHLPPAHHETRKHDSPNETKVKEKQNETTPNSNSNLTKSMTHHNQTKKLTTWFLILWFPYHSSLRVLGLGETDLGCSGRGMGGAPASDGGDLGCGGDKATGDGNACGTVATQPISLPDAALVSTTHTSLPGVASGGMAPTSLLSEELGGACPFSLPGVTLGGATPTLSSTQQRWLSPFPSPMQQLAAPPPPSPAQQQVLLRYGPFSVGVCSSSF
jgi:hypothetical protein